MDRDRHRAAGSNGSGTRRRLATRRVSLPAQRDRFIERPEVDAARALLSAGHRLLTLTGLGGIGKTRIALTVAARMADVFVGGVELVDLTSCIDADTLHHRIASDLGIHVPGGHHVSQAIHRSFAMRAGALVVLDNAEHVSGRPWPLSSRATLDEPSGATLLVTSRAPLDVQGERTLSVGSAVARNRPRTARVPRRRCSSIARTPRESPSGPRTPSGSFARSTVSLSPSSWPRHAPAAFPRTTSSAIWPRGRSHSCDPPTRGRVAALLARRRVGAIVGRTSNADLQASLGMPDGSRGNVLVRAGASGDAADATGRRRARAVGLARDAAVRRRALPDARAHRARPAAQGHPRRIGPRAARPVPRRHSLGSSCGNARCRRVPRSATRRRTCRSLGCARGSAARRASRARCSIARTQ